MSVRVQVPADVDREDRLLGDLTGRQVLSLLVAGLLAWLVWSLTGPTRLLWCVAAITPIAAAAALLAWGRRDGVPLDRLAVAAVRQRLQTPGDPGPRPPEAHRDLNHDGAGEGPGERSRGGSRGAARGGRGRLVVPRVPVRGVHSVTTDLGVVDLGPRGMAVVCTVTPIPLALRSESEQDAAVAGLGAWLSALSGPVQILTRTRHLDLADVIQAATARAARLAHPALAAAAHDHAAHLATLGAEADLTTREHLLIFRDPTPARPSGSGGPGVRGRAALTAVEVLWRRADEATALLGRLGLHVRALDAPTAAGIVAAATRPDHRPRDPIQPAPPEPTPSLEPPGPQARRGGPRRTAGRGPRVDDPPTMPLGPIRPTRHPDDPASRRAPFTGPADGARPHHRRPRGMPSTHSATDWDAVDDLAVDDLAVDDVAVDAANDDPVHDDPRHDADNAERAGVWRPGRISAALNPDEGRAR